MKGTMKLAPSAVLSFATAALTLPTDACANHVCTEVGCLDSVTLTIQSSGGAWTSGMYDVVLTVDGREVDCTLSIPTTASGFVPNGIVRGTCTTPDASLSLTQAQTCANTAMRNPDGTTLVSMSCTFVPGQFSGQLRLQETPSRIVVNVTRDGQPVGNAAFAPQYDVFQPNGSECAPTCHEASTTVMIAG